MRAASTGRSAGGAAAIMASTRTRHSSFPVANTSRKEARRDMDHSIAAKTAIGLLSINVLAPG